MGLSFKKICEILSPIISKIPMNWDGKKSILEMKENNARNWKQMEWIGWYFEYWCNKHLKEVMEMPCSKRYGNVSFDGYLEIPWDFKSHSMQSGNKIIINDSEATSNAISDFGCVGLILATGSVTYDNESRNFQKWHGKLKGGRSVYEIQRIARGAPSRKRKISMEISQILFVRIDDDLLVKCGSFQENFRNSNGNARREKVLLDLTKIDSHTEYVITMQDILCRTSIFDNDLSTYNILCRASIFDNEITLQEILSKTQSKDVIGEGKTPAEMCGIQINGKNKWITLIQNASRK